MHNCAIESKDAQLMSTLVGCRTGDKPKFEHPRAEYIVLHFQPLEDRLWNISDDQHDKQPEPRRIHDIAALEHRPVDAFADAGSVGNGQPAESDAGSVGHGPVGDVLTVR